MKRNGSRPTTNAATPSSPGITYSTPTGAQDLDHSRGTALGYTISLPREDRYLTTKRALMEQLAMTLGGRAAEELVFNEVTTGAANNLEKVTHTAKQMIMRYGMAELGPRVLGRNQDMPFLGREMSSEPDYSEEIAREIDDEIGA